MVTNRNLIRKSSIDSSTISTYGKLNPEQSNKFIDYMRDECAFMKDVRTIAMSGPQYDLDFIGISSRIVRKGVEATDPMVTSAINTSRKRLTTTEVILPQDVTLNFLEDNIERAAAEDHIARLLSQQFANDLCDLAINGDTATQSGATDYNFLSIADGFLKQAKVSGAGTHVFDTNASEDYKGVVFKGMLEALPNKYQQNLSELRFYVSPAVAQAYIDQLTSRQTAWSDTLLQTGELPKYKGVTIFPVQYMPDGDLILTQRMNLAMGVQRTFTFDRERKPRKRIYEFTMTSRIDPAKIVHDDALVIGYNAA